MFLSPYRHTARLCHDGYDTRQLSVLKRLSDTLRFALSAAFHGIIAALYLAIILVTLVFEREEDDDPVHCTSCGCNLGGRRVSTDTRAHYCDRCFMGILYRHSDSEVGHLERCLSLPEADR